MSIPNLLPVPESGEFSEEDRRQILGVLNILPAQFVQGAIRVTFQRTATIDVKFERTTEITVIK
jgi:hypothetical protein